MQVSLPQRKWGPDCSELKASDTGAAQGYPVFVTASEPHCWCGEGNPLAGTKPCDCVTLALHRYATTAEQQPLWALLTCSASAWTRMQTSLWAGCSSPATPGMWGRCQPCSHAVPGAVPPISQGDARRMVLLYRGNVFTIQFLQTFLEIPCG